MGKISTSAKLFVGTVAVCGLAVLGLGAWKWQCSNYFHLLAFLLLAAIASGLKVRLPGMTTTMSVNVPLVLIALVELGFAQALLIGGVSTAVQCLWKARTKPQLIQVIFNVCNTVNALGLAHLVFTSTQLTNPQTRIALVVGASAVYFIASTIPVAIIVGLTEQKRIDKVWQQIFFFTYPYYVLSTGLVVMAETITRNIEWQAPVLIVVLMYGVYRSYLQYFTQAQLQSVVAIGQPVATATIPEAAFAVAASVSATALTSGNRGVTPHKRL